MHIKCLLQSWLYLDTSIPCNAPPWGRPQQWSQHVAGILYLRYKITVCIYVHLLGSLPYQTIWFFWFRVPWLRFSMIFLSCKANARVGLKNGARPSLHSSHKCFQSVRLGHSGFKPQTPNQPVYFPHKEPTVMTMPRLSTRMGNPLAQAQSLLQLQSAGF